MAEALKDQTVLVVGRGGGLARAIVLGALDGGARVVAAGREPDALAAAYGGETMVSAERVDLTDEGSIARLGERLGTVDVAAAVMFALTDTFLTGQTLHVDGGEPLT
ncbi:MAG: hypothetical protein JO016_16410 [Actinobacteria bacterium]|nr:hypothetical protein [Actinomycetota bacterium]